jgi:hypothetical protein
MASESSSIFTTIAVYGMYDEIESMHVRQVVAC